MKKIFDFIRLWPEIVSWPIALFAWLVCPIVLRIIDPTAGVLDAGFLEAFLFAAVGLVFFNGIIWMGIKFNFPTLFSFYSSLEISDAFKSITPWQKIISLLGLYFAQFTLAVWLTQSILERH